MISLPENLQKMKYDLTNSIQNKQAQTYFTHLIKKQKFIELKELRGSRSLQQNKYLYLLLSWYAIEYGESIAYIKLEVYKKIVNRDDFKTEFVNKKTGEVRESWKSITVFDKIETTKHITRFRNYSIKEANIYLPEAGEYGWLQHIEIEIEKHKYYI